MPENRIAMYGRKACSAYGWFGKPFRLANYIMPKPFEGVQRELCPFAIY